MNVTQQIWTETELFRTRCAASVITLTVILKKKSVNGATFFSDIGISKIKLFLFSNSTIST